MEEKRASTFSAEETDQLLESVLKDKLSLSIEERIASHENARRLLKDLYQAGKELRARSKQAS